MQLDHLAVTCADLGEGVAYVEDALGVTVQPGGQHPRFGTHNRLFRLGPGEYFEVIAPDPSAIGAPDQPLWFGLATATRPRLGNWIVRVPDLALALALALATGPVEAGDSVAMVRGDLSWDIAVPPDGSLAFGGAFPTLMSWQGTAPHPSTRLTDQGISLTALDISHPQAAAIAAMIGPHLPDPRLRFHVGSLALQATFATPHGPRTL